MRVVEAFVNSGGNAILRTADGNIISSGVGSGFTGYGSSSAAFVGSMITVGSRGQVYVSSTASASVKMESLYGVRGITGSRGRVYIGSAFKGYYTPIGGGSVNVRVIKTSYSSSSGKVVISSSGVSGGAYSGSGGAGGSSGAGGASGGAGGAGGASGGSGGSGSASGGAGGAGGASGGSGVSGVPSGGSVGVGGIVTGANVLGSAASMGANGAISRYGTGFGTWTIQGATTDGAKEVEVIGDFGGEQRLPVLLVSCYLLHSSSVAP